jgi:glycosyltransferase involved in cell wall biosynthesis
MPHKGIDTVVRALPPGRPFVICGRPYDANYFTLLRRLARGKDVTFVTDADDRTLTQLYGTALAVILPSVHVDVYGNYHPYPELLGLTMLEGAGSGCFAICRKIGGMPEFIGDAECGASFETDSELRELLASIAANRDKISCTAAVRKRADWAMQTHGLRATGERVLKVYGQVCHERRG